MDSPKKQASKILRDKKMYQRWLAIFMCLALVVTSGTLTALKLTGQAWTGTEQVYACTYTPHQHTEQCYDAEGKLVCGYSDLVLHTHDARCYDSEGSLICTMEELEEHSHTSECYTEVKTLICTEEEHEAIPAHKHSDECYTTETVEQKDLTCGLEEGANAVEAQPAVEGHHHTDACYTITPAVEATYDEEGNELTAAVPEQRTLTCGLEESEGQPAVEAVPGHVHTEECYTTQQVEKQVLTCGLEEHDEEIPAHHHSDECYTTEMVLNCDKPELIAHEHTDDCYEIELDEDGNEISRTLTCKLPQLVAHQHGDECFTEVALEAEGTYCGKEAHKHTGSCYMDVNGELVLTCGKEEHVHTDECFIEPVLYCGKEEHTHTEECYDADGNLICELEEHTHTAECYIEPEIEPVEVTETVANRFYNVELTAVYTGELAEEDELAIVAATTSQEEMETERDYAYSSQVPDSKVLPLGRTEFVLTKNGEEVDRSEYAITATIIPSRESVAYLAMSQGDTDIMMLDEGGEPGGEQTIVVSSGFTAYELEDGKLAPVGYVEARLDEIDLDSYMAEAYDEEGNPVYDESLAIHARLSGSDFMLTAGVDEDVIQTLAEYDQSYYDSRIEVWWDEYTVTSSGRNETRSDLTPNHIDKVTMTPSTNAGEKSGNEYTINEGTSDAPKRNGGVQIGNFYPNATAGNLKGSDWVDAKDNPDLKDSAQYVRLTFSGYMDSTYNRPNQNVSPWKVGDLYKDNRGQTKATFSNVSVGDTLYYRSGIISPEYKEYATIEKIEYYVDNAEASQQMGYALLEITPRQGYYVTDVTIACVHEGHTSSNDGLCKPWDCGIWKKGDAFTKTFTVAQGTQASVVVPSEVFCHGDYSSYYKRCYILVRTAAIPSPLFVKYEPGTIGDQEATSVNAIFENNALVDGWMDNASPARSTATNNVEWQTNVDRLRKTNGDSWALSNDGKYVKDLRYTTAGISDKAKQAAAAVGYEFAGWKIEYFNTAKINGQTASTSQEDFTGVVLSDSYGTTPGTVGAKQPVDLIINAVLTAQWKAIPAASITKTVTGLEGEDANATHTFKFTVTDANGNTPAIKTEELRLENVNGKPEWVSYIVESDNPFTITITGNDTDTYKIYGLQNDTYTVEETEVDEAKKTTVNGTVGTKTTFKVTNSSAGITTANNIEFVNDYSDLPQDQQVTILKMDASNQTEQGWPTLAGAKFTLTADPSIVIPEDALKDETGADGIAFDGRLPVGTYTLTEDTAPTGYKGEGSIEFEVLSDGRVTVTNDGTNGNYVLTVSGATAVHKDPDDLTSPIIRYEIRVKNTVAPAQVKVIKVSNQNKETTLPDAHFDLYKEVTEDTAGAKLIYDKDTHKIYGIKVNENDIITDNLGEAMLVDKTLTDGSGLQFDQRYYLIETQAPAGYNGSDQPIELYYYKVTGTQTFELEVKSIAGSSLEAERVLPTDKENPVWGVKVPNSTGTEMPHTGGMGTGLFTVGGGLLMVLAAGLYFWNKRRISEM